MLTRAWARGSPPPGDAAERARLVAQIDVVGIGPQADVDQAVDVADVHGRPEQERVDEAEHRDVGADPQGKGEDDGEREPGAPGQATEREGELPTECGQRHERLRTNHSYLRAFTGSTRVAIRAGRKLATSATKASAAAAPAYATGSSAPTP